MTLPDRRLLAARADLAAASLRGLVEAPRYAEPRPMRVATYQAALRRAPRSDATLDTEALFGEDVDVYDIDEEGWAWVQLAGDGYVGYLAADDLMKRGDAPTHVVSAPRTYIYPAPDMKQPPIGARPLGARLTVADEKPANGYVKAAGGFVFGAHLRPVDRFIPDHAALAERLRGVPYLWGGRTALGLDCSALVQLCLAGAGVACPRDSDLQAASLGQSVAITPALTGLERGDLVFWRGHVGMMLNADHLIHANAHHMMVEIEPLREAARRIEAGGGGPVTHLKAMGADALAQSRAAAGLPAQNSA